MRRASGGRQDTHSDADALRADGGVALRDQPAEALVDDPGAVKHLRRARRLAHLLDEAFTIPVIRYRIGVDAVAGVVPFVGDVLVGFVSLLVVWEAFRLGVRKRTLARMLLYVALDVAVGSIPFVGDILDATLKFNLRNVRAIERDLAGRS